MKPYYEHGGITIFHGDCREVLPQLESRLAILGAIDFGGAVAITDPPYGVGLSNHAAGKERRAGSFEIVGDHSGDIANWFLEAAGRIPVVMRNSCQTSFSRGLRFQMNRLRANERCPIHHRLDCCGRKAVKKRPPKYTVLGTGTRLLLDGRLLCSPAVLRRRKDRLLGMMNACHACHRPFDDYSEVELSHKVSKGMNGGKRDDRWSNLMLLHSVTNRDMGSRSWEQYKKDMKDKKFPCEKGASE